MTDGKTFSDSDENRYLVYNLGEELYATPILEIREVIEPTNPKKIPNTVEAMTGVINLRGQIVGVVNLHKKFNLKECEDDQFQAFIVFDTPSGPLAAIVDKVSSVATIASEDIDRNPNISTNIQMEYISGVGKYHDQLVTIIKLDRILDNQELKSYAKSKFAA